jgi:hypothetical protein
MLAPPPGVGRERGGSLVSCARATRTEIDRIVIIVGGARRMRAVGDQSNHPS